MLHQTKWIGLSLALHLAAAVVLTVVAAHNAERTPDTIMVTLVALDSPDISRLPTQNIPVRNAAKPPTTDNPIAAAVSKPEMVNPEPLQNSLQPIMPRGAIPSQPPEKSLIRTVPKITAEQIPTVSGQDSPISSFQASEPEKAQQRYLKEHFIYIRDLITKQLVYPPMARKMGWSGKVIVAFIITEDGTVHHIRVVESSGYSILDRCAAETVQMVSPFPKPPVRAEIVVPINFKIM